MPNTAVPNDNPLVAVAAFRDATEAHLLRGWLEDEGLFCALSNEFIAATDSPVAAATGGVSVLVRAADAARAGAIYRSFQDAPALEEESDL